MKKIQVHPLLVDTKPGSPTSASVTVPQTPQISTLASSTTTHLPGLFAELSNFVQIVNSLLLESRVDGRVGTSCYTDSFGDVRQMRRGRRHGGGVWCRKARVDEAVFARYRTIPSYCNSRLRSSTYARSEEGDEEEKVK
jgi:hypothetical protein